MPVLAWLRLPSSWLRPQGRLGDAAHRSLSPTLGRPGRRTTPKVLAATRRINPNRASRITDVPSELPGYQDHEDIRARMHAGRRQRVPWAAGRRFRGAYHG